MPRLGIDRCRGMMTNQGNFWQILVILISPAVGSWVGVMIDRLPRGETLIFGRSHCDVCQRSLGMADLVPVLSFIISRGRCRYCAAPIKLHLLLVELASLAMALSLCAVEPAGPWLMADAALGWVLLALTFIDMQQLRLPDSLTLPLLLGGLLVCALTDFPDLYDHSAAAALGYLGLRGLAMLFRLIRGVEGIGGGDAKLFAAGGAWLGLAALPDILMIAGISGLILFGITAFRQGGLSRHYKMPFGPCLALAIWLLRLNSF